MKQLVEKICKTAREAGDIMRSAREDSLGISQKGSFKNLVTQYDQRIQEFLFQELHEILPEAKFLGEEEGQDIFREEYREGWLFVIDPIDGTSNFICGYGPSVTSIGLFRDGKPYIGVIYNPWSDDMFAAGSGEGAFRNGKPIHTSEASLSESLVVFGTAPYYAEEKIRKAFDTGYSYMKRCIDIRRSGSAAWDLCQVACGAVGLYFEPVVQIWDYAAGAAILLEAGGILTDLEGNELTYSGQTSILAATRGVAAEDYISIPENQTELP